jgi:hypothetical protein
MMSTPNGQRGFFYEEWAHGGEEWERISVPATECSRIKREFLEEERAKRDGASFQQSICASFERWKGRCFHGSRLKRRFMISSR